MILDHSLNRVNLGLAAISFLFGAVQIHGACVFQRIRHLQIIKKRFPTIVLIEASVTILLILVVFPIHYINKLWINATESETDPDPKLQDYRSNGHHLVRVTLHWLVIPALCYLLILLEAIRLFLIYYRLRLLESYQSQEWGSQITSTFATKDYYLRNRARFGNAKWICKRVGVYWLTITILTAVGQWYVATHSASTAVTLCVHIAVTFFMLSPMAFIAFLWRRLPKNLLDNMMMDSEFKITCGILCIGTLGYLALAVLFGLSHDLSLTSGLAGICTLFSTAAPSLMSTLWIPRQIRRNQGIYGLSPCRDLVLELGLFKDRQARSNGVRMTDLTQELDALYRNERKMGALMAHMAREFSLESFLCFVELVQFKNLVISMIQEQIPEFDPKTPGRPKCQFYGHCPKSSIVFNRGPQGMDLAEVLEGSVVVEMSRIEEEPKRDNDTLRSPIKERTVVQQHEMGVLGVSRTVHSTLRSSTPSRNAVNDNGHPVEMQLTDVQLAGFKHTADLFFEKYIRIGSNQEINISGPLRDHFYGLKAGNYEAISPMEWATLYNRVIMEMEQYMFRSYSRMINTLNRAEQEENARRRC